MTSMVPSQGFDSFHSVNDDVPPANEPVPRDEAESEQAGDEQPTRSTAAPVMVLQTFRSITMATNARVVSTVIG